MVKLLVIILGFVAAVAGGENATEKAEGQLVRNSRGIFSNMFGKGSGSSTCDSSSTGSNSGNVELIELSPAQTAAFLESSGRQPAPAVVRSRYGGDYSSSTSGQSALNVASRIVGQNVGLGSSQTSYPAPGRHSSGPGVQRGSAPIPQATVPIQQISAPIQQASAPIQQASAPIQRVVAPVQRAPAPVQHAYGESGAGSNAESSCGCGGGGCGGGGCGGGCGDGCARNACNQVEYVHIDHPPEIIEQIVEHHIEHPPQIIETVVEHVIEHPPQIIERTNHVIEKVPQVMIAKAHCQSACESQSSPCQGGGGGGGGGGRSWN